MSGKFMRGFVGKLSLWAVAALAVFVLSGCAGAPGLTAKQVNRRHVNVNRSNWKMIQDDADAVLLWDQPSRLSPMPVR